MVKCSYCGKSSSCKRTNHRFPLNDPTLLKEWLKNMEVEDGWTPTVHSRLCSEHFLDDCYKTNPASSRITLQKGSLPTVFTETKKKCAYCKVSKSRGSVKRSFHRFPLSSPKTLEKWLYNMAIKDWYPTEESRLCSDHFESSCFFSDRGYLTLRDGSLPSIFFIESRIGNAISINPPEVSPVTGVTELDQGPSQQTTNIDQTELLVILLSNEVNVGAEPAVVSSESLMTCPQSNHPFNSEGVSENLELQSSSNENRPKRLHTDRQMNQDEISESIVEIGLNAPCEESEPAVISSRSELEFRHVDEMRKWMAHDHCYETNPHSAKRTLQSLRESNKKLRQGLKNEKRRCNRMKKKITSLQEVVGELRRNRTLSETV